MLLKKSVDVQNKNQSLSSGSLINYLDLDKMATNLFSVTALQLLKISSSLMLTALSSPKQLLESGQFITLYTA